MPIQRIRIEIPFRIQRNHLAIASENQGIDFSQRSIRLPEGLIQALEDGTRLSNRCRWNADLAGEAIGLRIGKSCQGIHKNLVNFLGMSGRHLFNIHAAFA